ncbi:MAG: VWA domain-containing protein [Candidatus Riflebacteria bacterium]|nr:VWA domain-containing protein [Candidatus Riflebacteria bacterium]
MNKIRLLFLIALTVNLLMMGWETYGGPLVASLTAETSIKDDWFFKATPIDSPAPPAATTPWAVLAAWFVLEILRLVILGNSWAEWGVVVLVVAVLASVAGPMVGSITDQGVMSAERAARYNDLALSVGGAKDVNTFRRNLKEGKLPDPADVTFEGLYYDYTFDTGKASAASAPAAAEPAENGTRRLFYPSYACAVSKHPLTGETERYLAVGLNSDLKESDFRRKKLNLVVVLDISGSMSAPFDRYYYDRFTGRDVTVKEKDPADRQRTKLEIACRSIVTLLDHLKPDDRFGMVLFDGSPYLAKSLRLISATDLPAIRKHILDLKPQGSTNMEAGMEMGIDLLKPYSDADPEEWENRIVFLTDAMPNTDDTSASGLLGLTKAASQRRIHFSFVGMGLDFTSELIEAITKVRGANYCAVFSAAQFEQKLVDEFEFMVTPLLFDLALSVRAEGYRIEKVYGSPEADQSTGELMRVNTLFPTRTIDGEAKGGLVLLKLAQTGDSPRLVLEARCEDRSGRIITNRSEVTFPAGEAEIYDNSGIRKGVLLTRYGQLVKDWLTAEKSGTREVYAARQAAAGLGIWERPSQDLTVDGSWGSRMRGFLEHFRRERMVIGDGKLAQEETILENLAQRTTRGG